VLVDGVIYCVAGIFPLEGICVCAVDAASGRVLWTNDEHSFRFSAMGASYGPVALGHMAVGGDVLILPGVASMPARFDRRTGRLFPWGGADDSYRHWTCEVAVLGEDFMAGHVSFGLTDGRPKHRSYSNAQADARRRAPVVADGMIYGVQDGWAGGYRLDQYLSKEERRGHGVKWPDYMPAWRAKVELGSPFPWEPGGPPGRTWRANQMHIKAGPWLIASGSELLPAEELARRAKHVEREPGPYHLGTGAVIALMPPREGRSDPEIVWSAAVDGDVTGVIAADGKLFAATAAGTLFCFGAAKGEPVRHDLPVPPPPDAAAAALVAKLIGAAGMADGYGLVLGVGDGRLVEALAGDPRRQVIAVDADAAKLQDLTRRWDARGLLGSRVTPVVADPLEVDLPLHFAPWVTTGDGPAAVSRGAAFVARAYRCVRPYGGVLAVPGADAGQLKAWAEEAKLPGARVAAEAGLAVLRREGLLPDTGDWDHDYADAANSMCSPGSLPKAPLGIQWFGGRSSGKEYYYLGFNQRSPSVRDGRIFTMGPGRLNAIDVYTGRPLWSAPLPLLEMPDWSRLTEEPRGDWIVGRQVCTSRGFNYAVGGDGLYLCLGRECVRFDPASGKEFSRFDAPAEALGEKELYWGTPILAGDVLVATLFRLDDLKVAGVVPGAKVGGGAPMAHALLKDRLPMAYLAGFDRRTGKLLWIRKAAFGFLNKGVCAGNGRVYGLDLMYPHTLEGYSAAGRTLPVSSPLVFALDGATGKELWREPAGELAIDIAYSTRHDMLVVPSRTRATWKDGRWESPEAPKGARGWSAPPGVTRAYRGGDGRLLWENGERMFEEPLILRGDLLITRKGRTYELLTGKPATRRSPLTGQPEGWSVVQSRGGGCNYFVANDSLAAFQHGCFDIAVPGGRIYLGCYRGGCSPTQIPANGMLSVINTDQGFESVINASFGLVHRPSHPLWITYFPSPNPPPPADVRRLAVSFGVGFDTIARDGTVWLRYPGSAYFPRVEAKKGVPGSQPGVTPAVAGANLDPFQYHPERLAGHRDEPHWQVFTGEVEGIEKISLATAPGTYSVCLYFAEPGGSRPGDRVFDVTLQGKPALKGLDIAKEAGGPRRGLVKRFDGVDVGGELAIDFSAASGRPLVCGLELVR
jgi:outer membrane protein assembly factor BamB